MKEILINKSKEVLKELIDYLDGNKLEIEKNFILGRLSVVEELLKVLPIEKLNDNCSSVSHSISTYNNCTPRSHIHYSDDVRENIDFSENINYDSTLTTYKYTTPDKLKNKRVRIGD